MGDSAIPQSPEEKLTQERLAILKIELPILATKIGSTVDTLWKVRTVGLTAWIAVFGAGLGQFDENKHPVPFLLVLSCVLPLWFAIIDAKNHQWYRRLELRENAIQSYINKEFIDVNGVRHSFSAICALNDFAFPLYDLAGEFTYAGSKKFEWEVSFRRNLAEPIPVLIYGSQTFLSSVAFMAFCPIKLAVFLPILSFTCWARPIIKEAREFHTFYPRSVQVKNAASITTPEADA